MANEISIKKAALITACSKYINIFLGIFFVLVGLFCLAITTNLDKDIDDRNISAAICVISFFIAFGCFCN